MAKVNNGGMNMHPVTRIVVAAVLLLSACGLSLGGTTAPDAAGYRATDQTPFSFQNIVSTGARVLAGTDDGTANVNIGFTFRFYGQDYSSLCISTNGLIAFGGCNMDFANVDLSNASPSGDARILAPFWTDLSFDAPGTDAVYYQVLGTAPQRQFVVQWNSAFPLNASSGVTFQVVLYEGSNQIRFQYLNVGSGGNGRQATVGIRDAGGQSNNRQIQWSYNAPVLANGESILFSLQPPVPFNLGTAGPQSWALLGLGGPTNLTMSGSSVITGTVANVGIATSGNVVMSGSGRINGQLWLNTAGTLTKSVTTVIAGGVVKTAAGDAALLQAAADARAASTAAAALTPTIQTSPTIVLASKTMTISGGPGVNVVSLTSVTIANGVLTLSAPAGATFVVNTSGSLTLSGGSGAIRLAGGLTPLDVLFNITGTGSVTMSGGSTSSTQFSGILLAPRGSVTMSPPSIAGELIVGGAAVTISGSGQIRNP
jgi:hypothetical protein